MTTLTSTEIKTYSIELVSTKEFADLISDYPEEEWDWGTQRAETVVLAFSPSELGEWLEGYNQTHDYPMLFTVEHELERIEWTIKSVREINPDWNEF